MEVGLHFIAIPTIQQLQYKCIVQKEKYTQKETILTAWKLKLQLVLGKNVFIRKKDVFWYHNPSKIEAILWYFYMESAIF
jgi:hypothetical protein